VLEHPTCGRTRFDVLVAGAGPAGSTLALRLAREGFSVAIVEPKRFPRPKPCGEFLSPECLPVLRELGLESEVLALGAREVRGMRLHGWGARAHGRYVSVGSSPLHDHGIAVRRERFDAVLLRGAVRAGVEVFEGEGARSLLRGADGAVEGLVVHRPAGGDRALRAAFTVGADGLRSRVAGDLGVRERIPWLDKLAVTTHWCGVPWGSEAEVHFLDGGYIACAPVDEGLVSVNLVVDRPVWVAGRGSSGDRLEDWIARVAELSERLARGARSGPIRGLGPLAMRTRSQVFDGAALVGDACGYVDPVTGEGVWFALAGARSLAEAITRALHARRRDRAALAAYAAFRRRELAPRAAFAALLQRGLRRPRLARAALSLLSSRPRLADVLVSIAGDYVPLAEIRRPAVWLGALCRPGRDAA